MKTLLSDKANEFPEGLNNRATTVIENKKPKTFTIGTGSCATEVVPVKNGILLVNT
jgi:hypothetical protein